MKATVLLESGVQSLFGTRDENLRLLEESFHVELHLGDEGVGISGDDDRVARARRFVQSYADLVHG